ncbi:MAG: hypothetical protein H8E44_10300 [Planctomycetes bacterium]|nr:hypothetical protein [Planctomycetota bacterium]MBL7042037.1 hypothetical protein [Pirellulaceae bacterium]
MRTRQTVLMSVLGSLDCHTNMSIYATLWSIQIQDPVSPFTCPKWVEVTAQAVPPHIGSPTPGCGYEDGDPYGDFLPPPVETDESGQAPYDRAVVFVTEETRKGTARNGQEYVEPLLVLTGEEYTEMPFQVLLDRLKEAVRSGPTVVGEFLAPDGTTRIFTEDDV